IFEALDIQDELQTLYTSGTVFHAFLGEKLPDWKAAAALVRKIAENYKLPYYTLSPTYSVCKNHGYIAGETYTCPHCGEKTEVYSRITGYYRPVKNWNDGKSQEYKDRKVYNVSAFEGKDPTNKADCVKTCACESKPEQITESVEEAKLTLFATKSCPNCKMAVHFLEKAGIAFTEVFADENPDLARANGIRQAPTLVVEAGGETQKIVNLSNIKAFIENAKA
ncbi:MAG: ribonucleoside triphosphate reductase, partial [Clostridia bacterium]|nr:ribonucleoside triphosphate reductase [Clostridia bacterium]